MEAGRLYKVHKLCGLTDNAFVVITTKLNGKGAQSIITKYSQTCLLWPPKGDAKSGLYRQVVFMYRFLQCMFQ